jgi:hypothetical protein
MNLLAHRLRGSTCVGLAAGAVGSVPRGLGYAVADAAFSCDLSLRRMPGARRAARARARSRAMARREGGTRRATGGAKSITPRRRPSQNGRNILNIVNVQCRRRPGTPGRNGAGRHPAVTSRHGGGVASHRKWSERHRHQLRYGAAGAGDETPRVSVRRWATLRRRGSCALGRPGMRAARAGPLGFWQMSWGDSRRRRHQRIRSALGPERRARRPGTEKGCGVHPPRARRQPSTGSTRDVPEKSLVVPPRDAAGGPGRPPEITHRGPARTRDQPNISSLCLLVWVGKSWENFSGQSSRSWLPPRCCDRGGCSSSRHGFSVCGHRGVHLSRGRCGDPDVSRASLSAWTRRSCTASHLPIE